MNHIKWHHYAKNNRAYKRKKRLAKLYMIVPIVGILLAGSLFDEMGLSVF